MAHLRRHHDTPTRTRATVQATLSAQDRADEQIVDELGIAPEELAGIAPPIRRWLARIRPLTDRR